MIAAVALLAFILTPFFLWGDQIEAWATTFVRSGPGWWQAAGVVTALLASDILLPIPSSLLSVAGGALLGFAGGLAASWIGMTLGCLLGYELGKRAPRRWLSDAEIARMQNAQRKYGDWILILFRSTPVLAEASVLFSGFMRVPRGRFLAWCALSNLGISAVYAAAGAFFSGKDSFLLAFLAAVLLPAVTMWLTRRWR